MNATYDAATDTLTIIFKPGAVAESDEEKRDIVLDYNTSGELVSMEILDASKHIPSVTSSQFNVQNSPSR